MNQGTALTRAQKIEELTEKSPIFLALIEWLLKHPDMALAAIQVIGRLAKWAWTSMFDRTGKVRTPFWMRILSLFGGKNARELKAICNEACKVSDALPIAG